MGERFNGIEEVIGSIPFISTSLIKFHGPVAQLGERRTCTAEVAGSIPVRSTIFLEASYV